MPKLNKSQINTLVQKLKKGDSFCTGLIGHIKFSFKDNNFFVETGDLRAIMFEQSDKLKITKMKPKNFSEYIKKQSFIGPEYEKLLTWLET